MAAFSNYTILWPSTKTLIKGSALITLRRLLSSQPMSGCNCVWIGNSNRKRWRTLLTSQINSLSVQQFSNFPIAFASPYPWANRFFPAKCIKYNFNRFVTPARSLRLIIASCQLALAIVDSKIDGKSWKMPREMKGSRGRASRHIKSALSTVSNTTRKPGCHSHWTWSTQDRNK